MQELVSPIFQTAPDESHPSPGDFMKIQNVVTIRSKMVTVRHMIQMFAQNLKLKGEDYMERWR